jgi:predicted small lipoprotein YifL
MHHRLSTSALAIALALSLLAACGKKDPSNPADAAVATPSPGAESQRPRYKQTEKFGSVSAVVLDGTAALPARFASYQRQVATEWVKGEYQKQPDSAFEAYLKRWMTQAASVPKPEWGLLAKIAHPESADETNEFKKQDWADKTRQELTADPASLQMVMAYQAEYIGLDGPDVATGEYYLNVRAGARRLGVGYSNGKHNSNLNYDPAFDTLCNGCRDLQFTVKVPVARAREIEALRAKGKDMMRLYGRVTGFHEPATAIIDRRSATADLTLEIEAIEMGSRQDGEFKSYFILGPDQLATWQR